jgi:hypothetical protein
MQRPFEYYVAVVSAMIFVAVQHKDKHWLARVLIAGMSGGLGYSLAKDFALWTGRSEVLGAFLLTAFGYIVLDVVAAVLADRKLIREAIIKRLGGSQ